MSITPSKFIESSRLKSTTYAEWGLGAEDGAISWVDHDLKLLHAFSALGEERGEHLFELISDGQGLSLEGDLGVLDISDADRSAWNKLVAQSLQLSEGSTKGR